MLYLVFQSKASIDGRHNEMSRYVGTKIPICDNEEIKLIQADGQEKERIEHIFPSLVVNARTATYTGAFAELIFHNIRGKKF